MQTVLPYSDRPVPTPIMLFSATQAKQSLRLLSVPPTTSNLRQCTRAKFLLDSGHTAFVMRDEGEKIYHATNQSNGSTPYKVVLNGSTHSCNCPNSEKSEICKHRIAAMMHEHKSNAEPQTNEGFDLERLCHADGERFDYDIFRHESESYKWECLQGMH